MVVGVVVLAGAFGTCGGTLGLLWYLWSYRAEPGADWFLAALACQAAWGGLYGIALLAFDPTVRWVLEVVSLAVLVGLPACFLPFALEYTGRGRVRSPLAVGAVALVPVGTLVLGATNPLHHLLWTGFAVDPRWGLAAADYAFQPLALVIGTFVLSLPVLGSLLLFETVVGYGPLYRTEAAAVGLSPVPPMAGAIAWLYGIGPVPEVNAAVVLFVPHVLLDAYAFLGSDMFEFNPATRRAGERAAIDDLGSPVVVVDEDGRIVTLNPAAESVLGGRKRDLLATPLEAHLDGASVDPASDAERVTLAVDGTRRTFRVTSTPLGDGGARIPGYTLVWQDVTDEIRREQRLTVLNRVLRHNLRNDTTVVRGFVEAAADRVDDEAVVDLLERAIDGTDDLVALGQTARDVERVIAAEPEPRPVDLSELLPAVAAEVEGEFPGATVAVDPASSVVTADRETLRAVIRELVENGVVHGGPDPTVAVSVDAGHGAVAIRVADDGPGIPDAELSALAGGEESALDHGSGLGLWFATWGARRIGADLSFDVDDGGTTATVSFPRSGEPRAER